MNCQQNINPFLGWRRKIYDSKYTNIQGKYQNRISINGVLIILYGFWRINCLGSGVSDDNTIPSLFIKISGEKVSNFGETGWSSRQSLNQLLNLLGDKKPKRVIFYTGINDYHSGCRAENNILSAHVTRETIYDN